MEVAGGPLCNGQPVMAEELPEGEVTVLKLVRQVGNCTGLLKSTLQMLYKCTLLYFTSREYNSVRMFEPFQDWNQHFFGTVSFS